MEDSKPFITLSMLNGHTKWTGPGNALYDAAAQALGQEVRDAILTREADLRVPHNGLHGRHPPLLHDCTDAILHYCMGTSYCRDGPPPTPWQVFEARLANPAFRCGREELNGLWRCSCRWPFKCCNTRRPTAACPLVAPGYPRPPPESPASGDDKKRKGRGESSTPKRSKQD